MNLIQQPRSGPAPGEQRLLLHAVDWRTYEKFLDAVGERPLRLTYDRGNLEIMAPSWNHEWWKRRFGFVLPLLGAELNIEVQGGGSTTFRREDLERGLEPDECFYVGEHALQMIGLRNLDLTRDPPPDLAVEVEISPAALDRPGIYAALGVPELWRFDGAALRVYRLGADNAYSECQSSVAFPSLPLAEFVRFLQETEGLTDARLVRPFQEWVRAHALPGRPLDPQT
jgi:Uma2 family endonuclease